VTTVPDIPVVQLPALEADGVVAEAPASIWAMDVPNGRRPSPLTLAVLGVVAGIAAMVLGAAAVVSAGTSADAGSGSNVRPTATTPAAVSNAPSVERRVLALLAKPSTERIAFRGVPGLVLVVGSGGRAAILVRGLERAPAGNPYGAWIVTAGSPPVPAARFVGTEPAVFLSRQLAPRASVVISARRPVAGSPARNRIVALRD
jgi:Anti-sigma-K factor rskA, C-terminal